MLGFSRANPLPDKLTKAFFQAALFLSAAFVMAWSKNFWSMGLGLDPGWRSGLAEATNQGLKFGQDVIFTFGPFHQLHTNLASSQLAPLLTSRWIMGLAWGSLFLRTSKAMGYPGAWLFLLSQYLWNWWDTDSPFFIFCFATNLTTILNLRSEREPFFLQGLSVIGLSTIALTKLSLAGLAIPTLAALYITNLTRERSSNRKLLLTAVYVTCAAIPLLLSSTTPSDLFEYFFGLNREIVSGYASAMSTTPKDAILSRAMYLAGSSACIYLTQKLIWETKSPQKPTAITKISIIALLTLSYWIPFKAGFIREDEGHIQSAAIFLFSSGIFLFLIAAHNHKKFNSKYAIGIFPLAALLGWLCNPPVTTDIQAASSVQRRSIARLWSATTSHTGRELLRQETMFDVRRESNQTQIDDYKIPPGSTADVLPWDISDLLMNKLKYKPRPIIQSLNAYTKNLQIKNKSFFESGKDRPEYVILSMKNIDGRWPSVGLDGPAIKAIKQNYTFSHKSKKGALVFRVNNLASNPHQSKSEAAVFKTKFTIKPGRRKTEPISIPENLRHGSSIDILLEPTFLYKAYKFLFKPPFNLHAKVSFSDGTHSIYRVIPGSAFELPLYPFLEETSDLLEYMTIPTASANHSSTELLTNKKKPEAIRLILRKNGIWGPKNFGSYFKSAFIVIK